MPPRLPPPPQVSKPGTSPAESSKPTAEPDAWLLGELDALAGPPDAKAASEASGAKAASEASGAKAASEASGAKSKPPSEASGAKPAKPARSATAALVGIGDDLIANASPEDKPVFSTIIAKAEAKSASSEPAVFDELGLAKTPAVITGNTVRDIDTSAAKDDDGKIVVAADAPAPKKTDEGFPIPPPRPAATKAAPAATAASKPATASPSTSTSRGNKPMSRWTPHVLLGTLGLASIIAIAFRCSGTSTSTASADPGKKAPVVAKAGDDVRGASASGGASAGGEGNGGGGANGGAAEGDRAAGGGGAADDDDVQVDDDDKAGGGGQADGQAEGGDGAGGGTPTEDAAKDDAAAGDAAKDDAAAGDAAKDDAQAAATPTNAGGAAKDTTPASTSKSKSKSSPSPTPIGPSTPSPDANLTAEELLELARKAWAAGNSRDTYKYANKSRYKKNSAEATELATLSACKLKLEKSAKSSFDDLSGDKRRKVRQKCRDWGVWVGL